MKAQFFRLIFLTFAQICLWSLLGNTAKAQTEESNALGPENYTIENILCEGNKITSCSIIENEVYLHAGDKINEEEIENATLRLKTLGLFNDVQISLQKGNTRNFVNLIILVKEKPAAYANLSAYVSNRDNNNFGTAEVGNRNLFGTGKSLSLKYSNYADSGNLKIGSIKYDDPNLFGSSKYFATFSLTHYDSNNYDSTSKRTFGNLSFGRRIFDFSYIKAGMSTQLDPYRSSFDDSTKYIEYGWDTQNDANFPTAGTTFSARINSSNILGTLFYQSMSYVQNIHSDYYLKLNQDISYSNDSKGYLSLRPEISKYITFFREGEATPDRIKIYANPIFFRTDSKSVNNSGIITSISAGVLYEISSFGTINLSAYYEGGQ